MQPKTHWKKLINPDFLGAYSIEDGKDLKVVIKQIRRDIVVGDGGKQEECTIAEMVDNKPLILNRTNQKTIARLYGPYIEDWAGKAIALYASTTKLKGENVECLRIRPEKPVIEKPKIENARLEAAIKAIVSGSYTLEKLQETHALTKEQLAKATAALQEKPNA